MLIDKKKSWKFFHEIYSKMNNWQEAWEEVITFHEKYIPNANWKKIRAVDLASEEEQIVLWLKKVFKDKSLPKDLSSINFVMTIDEDYDEEDLIYLYVAGSDSFAFTEMEWARTSNFIPDPDHESWALSNIYSLLSGKSTYEDAVTIAFYAAAIFMKHILRKNIDLNNIANSFLKIYATLQLRNDEPVIDLPPILNSKYKFDFYTNFKYHRNVFELLDWELDYLEYSNKEFSKYDNFLPASYLEWCMVKNGNELLSLYSNIDHFFIRTSYDEDSIVKTKHGKILIFHQENEGNFSCGLLLNGSDDPPVMYSDFEEEEWVEYSKKFSDFIFCQIFDWKNKIKLGPDRYQWIIKYDTIDLKFKSQIHKTLCAEFEECPSTKFFWEGKKYNVHRYISDEGYILCKSQKSGGKGYIDIMSPNEKQLRKLSTKIKKLLKGHLDPKNKLKKKLPIGSK